MGAFTPRRVAVGAAAVLLVAVVVSAGFGRLPAAVALLGVLTGLLLLNQWWTHQRLDDLRRSQAGLRRSQADLRRSVHRSDRARRRQARESTGAVARHEEVLQAVATARSELDTGLRRLGDRLTVRGHEQTQQLEALWQLYRTVEPRAPMPSAGRWALDPADLLELWHVVDRRRPGLVLELGSGTSSVWLGYALQRYGGRLVTVEHDPSYVAQTRAHLRRHGLADVVEVREAPLRPVPVADDTYRWYDPAVLADLSGVELVLVDGPPGTTGPQARYPAVPVLADRLSPVSVVILDDADRPDEQEIVRQWTATYPGLVPEPATLGHLAVLAYTRPSASG